LNIAEKAWAAGADYSSAACAHNLGILLQKQHRVIEAEKAYRKAIENDPKDAAAYNNLGILMEEQRRPDEAKEAYRKAIEIDPKDAAAYNNLKCGVSEMNVLWDWI
jgi:Flp pilus assembly protein TadD